MIAALCRVVRCRRVGVGRVCALPQLDTEVASPHCCFDGLPQDRAPYEIVRDMPSVPVGTVRWSGGTFNTIQKYP